MSPDSARSARLAPGATVICFAFTIDATISHHMRPNLASPRIRAFLGAGGGWSLLAHCWFRSKAKRTGQ